MQPVQRIDITTSTIIRTVLVLVAFWLIYTAFDIVIMLFAAFIVASVAQPVADYFERWRVPRALSVISFYVLLLLVALGLLALMVDPLVDQIQAVASALPALATRLAGFTPLLPDLDQASVLQAVQSGLAQFGDNIASVSLNVLTGTRSFFSGLVNFLFVFVIALYLVMDREALFRLARLLVSQQNYPAVERAIEESQRSVGRWLLGQMTMGAIMGTLIGFWLFFWDVPYFLLLALLVAVLELIPAIGPLIAAIPGVLVGFSQGLVIGLIVWAGYVVVGQLENHVLIPNIMRRAVGLRPVVTLVSVIVGARLLGVLGIILAVPMAAVVSVFIDQLFVHNGQEELAG